MKYKVIAAFRDTKTDELVNPGDRVPKRLDAKALARLERAGCLEKVAGNGDDGAGSGGGGRKSEEPGLEAGLFPAAGTAPVAGGDDGAGGERSQPDGGSGPGGKGPGPDNSGQ